MKKKIEPKYYLPEVNPHHITTFMGKRGVHIYFSSSKLLVTKSFYLGTEQSPFRESNSKKRYLGKVFEEKHLHEMGFSRW